jgi:hypothetical protein
MNGNTLVVPARGKKELWFADHIVHKELKLRSSAARQKSERLRLLLSVRS